MSCTIKLKTQDFLQEESIISKDNEVLDAGMLKIYNKRLTELANRKYNVGNPGQSLFTVKDGKVEGNDRLFNLLEEATFTHDLTEIFEGEGGVQDVTGEVETNIFTLEENKTNSEAITNNKSHQVLFGDKKSVTLRANDVFTNILENSEALEGLNNETLLDSVRTLLIQSKAKVKFVDKLVKSNTMMQYNAKTNTIEIDLTALNGASDTSIVVAFLHEAVHSISVNLYNESGTVDAQIFRANLDSLFSIYQKNPVEGFSFTHPLEFLAEVFANPTLRTAIINNEVSRMNLWQQIVAAVRRSLGLPSSFDMKLQEIIENGDTFESISEDFPSLWERKKDAYQEGSTDLRTLEQRLERTLSRLDENINQNIQRLKKMEKRTKDETIAKNIADRIGLLNNVRTALEISMQNNTALGIVSFVNNMTQVLNYVETKISGIKYDDIDAATYFLTQYDNYLTTFSVVNELQDLLVDFRNDPDQEVLTITELNELETSLDLQVGKFKRLQSAMVKFKKEVLTRKLNDIKYFPQVLHKYRQKLGKEFDELNLPGDKQVYINENLAENGKEWDNMMEDVQEHVDKLLNNPIVDIKGVDKTFTSVSNISNNLVQIMHKKLIELDNRRLEIERKEDLKALEVFEALRAEKGSISVMKLYENIVQKGKDGKIYLKGEYDPAFLDAVPNKIKAINKEYRPKIDESWAKLVLLKKKVGNTAAYAEANRKHKELVAKRDSLISVIQEENLDYDKDGKASPKAKWKTNLDSLSKAEKDALEYYTSIIEMGDKAVYNSDTLKKYSYGGFFLEMPKITKSDLERLYQGDIKGTLKEKWDYLTETRADDTEYTNEDIDLAGEKHRQLRLHYRDRGGNFRNDLQSMDLANIFRMEFKNVNIYTLRQEKEMELSFLIDIAKSQKFYTKNGSFLARMKGQEKMHITANENSNLRQMLTNLMDYRFYDISNSVDQKFGKVDANKAVGYINAATAFMALSLNFASGTANVVNANAQMFLETFIKGSTFNAKGVAKANKIYGQTLADTLKDNVRGINRSYTNQIAEIFNIQGLFNLSDSNFLQASLLKKGMTTKSLQVFQDSGENWIQSVITMAILDNVKVMNADNKFIDKDGKVVKKLSQAASLLDMYKVDKETGMVDIDPAVKFTTHSPNIEWTKGGKEMVDILVRKKLDDSIGNYTQTQQAEVMRHYGGRMAMLFRKYLVPMGQARLLGIGTSHIKKENLREDQTRFSHALQEYEEGTYTTLIRYGVTSMKEFKTELLTRGNWKNLSDYEKHNIKRAVIELVMTFAILPKLIELSAMGATALDDDDKQRMYFLMYQMRRLQTELSSYRSVSEMFKMLKSPIPSARFIESAIDVMEQSFPTNWLEEDSKGNNQLLKSMNQFNPWRQFVKDFEKTFNYQNSNFQP